MKNISVIAPMYNVEEYLPAFLHSIQIQKANDIEIILVDDGSTDNSLNVALAYAETDDRVTVLHKDNGGVCSARNAGISVASGEYLYIVDSDDWLEEDALEKLWAEIDSNHSDIVYGMHYVHEGVNSVLKGSFPNRFYTTNKNTIKEIQCALLNNNTINCKCKEFNQIVCLGGAPWKGMVKRSIVLDNGIRYNEKLRKLGEDILFWQEVYEHVNSVSYIETPIYHYRKAENSLSHGYKQDLLDIYDGVFNEEEKFLLDHNKDEDHWIAYYFRIILYINQSLRFYYKNIGNRATEKEKYSHFVAMLKSEPYSAAIKNAPLTKLVLRKSRLKLLLLKTHMYRIYWKYCK